MFVEQRTDLFGDVEDLAKVRVTTIESFVLARLRSIFPGVAKPGLLENQKGVPMYLFMFACSNPRAVGPAMNIAEHNLKGLR
jgi:hypothetical protein